ncbi:MAG TPA: family 16 glycoside hydrolase [Geobacteraceae bacterium]
MESTMRMFIVVIAFILAGGSAFAESYPNKTTINFDKTSAGQLPAGWVGGVTGQGSPKWTVEADATAPSKPNVLKQSGEGTYPWCVKKDVSLRDGFVEVRFKPVYGSEDRAGGLVWRWQDGGNYYVARANALEDNVTIYHTVNGSRRSFKNVNMKVASNQWHTLRVDFAGNRFKVTFDGKVAIEATDNTFKEAGAVGVWTKSDSITLFDDFSYGGVR